MIDERMLQLQARKLDELRAEVYRLRAGESAALERVAELEAALERVQERVRVEHANAEAVWTDPARPGDSRLRASGAESMGCRVLRILGEELGG